VWRLGEVGSVYSVGIDMGWECLFWSRKTSEAWLPWCSTTLVLFVRLG
jgi:hypothetical protein